jgi:hypothetical protein
MGDTAWSPLRHCFLDLTSMAIGQAKRATDQQRFVPASEPQLCHHLGWIHTLLGRHMAAAEGAAVAGRDITTSFIEELAPSVGRTGECPTQITDFE